ncbi:Uncharacterised protein [Mycobacteroides abscessus]|nr:Uncharacterised protein [Mycobacteroides abscessus]
MWSWPARTRSTPRSLKTGDRVSRRRTTSVSREWNAWL